MYNQGDPAHLGGGHHEDGALRGGHHGAHRQPVPLHLRLQLGHTAVYYTYVCAQLRLIVTAAR